VNLKNIRSSLPLWLAASSILPVAFGAECEVTVTVNSSQKVCVWWSDIFNCRSSPMNCYSQYTPNPQRSNDDLPHNGRATPEIDRNKKLSFMDLECGDLDRLTELNEHNQEDLSKSKAQIKDNLDRLDPARTLLAKQFSDSTASCRRAQWLRTDRTKSGCVDMDEDLTSLRKGPKKRKPCAPSNPEELDAFKACEAHDSESKVLGTKLIQIAESIKLDSVRVDSLTKDIAANEHLLELIADVKAAKHCPKN
jgi:hypothetical protein